MTQADFNAWLRAEPERRARAVATRRGLFREAGTLALIATMVGVVALLAGTLQRVVLLGYLSQLLLSSFWTGLAIWAALAAIVVLVAMRTLGRWALAVPVGWLVAGAVVAHTGTGAARETVAEWNAETAAMPFAPPLPVPRGTPPYGYFAWPVAGLNGPLVQGSADRRFYRVGAGPCLNDAGADLRRLAPLLRSIERAERRAVGALCAVRGTRYAALSRMRVTRSNSGRSKAPGRRSIRRAGSRRWSARRASTGWSRASARVRSTRPRRSSSYPTVAATAARRS